MGAQGPARGGPQADDRVLPQGPLNPKLSVVVPCRDEQDSIRRYRAELFPILDALGAAYEVLIIDDGSSDETTKVADALAASRPGIRVIRLCPNRGLGGALRAGFAAARGEWIATIDADLTFRPEQLAELLTAAKKDEADLVAGSPFLRPGDMAAVPWSRRLPSLLLNALYRGLFGMDLTSYTPIFRLYRASRLRALTLTSEGFEINAEIAALAMLRRWRACEVPAALGTRSTGISKLNRGRELARHLRLICRLLTTGRS